MKSHLRLAVLATFFPLLSSAADAPSVDTYKALVQFRVENEGAQSTFNGSTSAFLSQFLEDPGSPYSKLIDRPRMTNEIWWPEFESAMSPHLSGPRETVLGNLQWQLGLTKARPDIDVMVSHEAESMYHGRDAAANALKAEVDADIFWKARDMNGDHFATAAGEAVALQILRDQLKRNDPDDYVALAIEPEVLKRYLAQTSPQNISSSDREYLGTLLRFALMTRPSFQDGGSFRQLPTIYRVARTAAAYSDARGYTRTGGYCSGNEPRKEAPNSWPVRIDAPACFIAANDRWVKDWYRWQLHDEAVRRPPPPEESGFSKLMHWVGVALLLVDGMALLETADTLIADDLTLDGTISTEEVEVAKARSSRLTCGIYE